MYTAQYFTPFTDRPRMGVPCPVFLEFSGRGKEPAEHYLLSMAFTGQANPNLLSISLWVSTNRGFHKTTSQLGHLLVTENSLGRLPCTHRAKPDSVPGTPLQGQPRVQ